MIHFSVLLIIDQKELTFRQRIRFFFFFFLVRPTIKMNGIFCFHIEKTENNFYDYTHLILIGILF